MHHGNEEPRARGDILRGFCQYIMTAGKIGKIGSFATGQNYLGERHYKKLDKQDH